MTAASRPATFDRAAQIQRSLIAKIHVGKKALGLSEDDYRAVLLRVTGKRSCADMTSAELTGVVEDFTRLGFAATVRSGPRSGKPRPADHPVARKARALWISLHQLGAIDNPSEAALDAFACRQLGVAKLQWADQGQGYKLIEALKAIADRAGWAQSLDGVRPAMKLLVLKRRLTDVLTARLRDAGLIPASWTADRAAYELGGVEVDLMRASAEELDVVARLFAAKLHGARS